MSSGKQYSDMTAEEQREVMDNLLKSFMESGDRTAAVEIDEQGFPHLVPAPKTVN